MFEATLEILEGGIAQITLVGELDAKTSQQLKERVEEAVAHQPRRLVLMMDKLDFMASSGIRVLAFAKKHIGPNADLHVVAPQAQVLDTMQMTGLHHAVVIHAQYDAAIISVV